MILLPFIDGMLRDETRDIVKANDGQLIELDPEDEYDYGRQLAQIFANTYAYESDPYIIIIEHDIVPTQEHLNVMASCDHEWCGSPYHVHWNHDNPSRPHLGCTKFSKTLILRTLPLWESIVPGCPWYSLAETIEDYLDYEHQVQSVHKPVVHLHAYPVHG